MTRISTLFTAVALVFAVAVPTVLASGGNGTRIALKPAKAFSAAKGSAKFRARGGERELQIEVEHIRRLAGKRVVVYVAARKLGTATLNGLGEARLNRNSDRGQFVPRIRAGTSVKVRTPRGALIVSGSF